MAFRELVVKVIGDTSSLERAFGRTSRSTSKLQHDLSAMERGVAAGSGAFRGLGRSIVFASGGFLAFSSATAFIRKSVDAAQEAQVANRQLARQLGNNGKAFADYRDQIDATVNRLSALAGIQNDELKAGLTTILRTTPDVDKALRDLGTAADLARARHISLAQAATVIAKTEAGNTTLLRRQGFQIAKNATAEQALATVRAKIAGQALAGTTAQERFGAVLHTTEEVIGTALLPTIERYLNAGSKWLQQMNESGSLQKNVANTAHDFSTAVHDVAEVVKVADKITGSFVHTLELLLGLKVATIVGGWSGSFVALGGSITRANRNAKTIIPNIDMRSPNAAVRVGRLTRSVTALAAAMGPGQLVAVTGLASFALTSFALKATGLDKQLRNLGGFIERSASSGGFGLLGKLLTPRETTSAGSTAPGEIGGHNVGRVTSFIRDLQEQGLSADQVLTRTKEKFASLTEDDIRELTTIADTMQRAYRSAGGAAAEAGAKAAHGLGLVKTAADAAAASVVKLTQKQLELRNRVEDTAAQRILFRTGFGNFTEQLAGLRQFIAERQKAFAQARDAERRARITDQLIEARASIRDIHKQIRDNAKAAHDAAVQAAKEAAQKRSDVEAKRLFGIIGLGPTGEVPAPTVATLKRELEKVSAQMTGTLLDTSANRSKITQLRKLFLDSALPRHAEVRQRAQDTIKAWLDGLNAATSLPRFKRVTTDALLKGLHLDPLTSRILRARLTQVGPGGSVPGGQSLAFAGAGARNDVVVHSHVHLDGREITRTVTRGQQKDSTRRTTARRGPYAGRH